MERTEAVLLKNAEKLDTDTRLALPLFEEYEFSVEKNENGGLILQIKDFFECTLTLTDGIIEPVPCCDEKIYIAEKNAAVTEEGDRICLSCAGEILKEDGDCFDFADIKLFFTEAEVRFSVYNLFDFGSVTSAPNPWLYIGEVCYLLKKKALANGKLLNGKERELLPLACFVADIAAAPREFKTAYSQSFVKLSKKCGDEKAVELVERKRLPNSDFVKTAGIAEKLNDACHEKLWRKIYALLLDSQKDYPSRPNEGGAQEKIENVRKAIAKTLHEQGFEGEYPSFFKKIDVKCAFAMFGGLAVTVFHEKDVSCFVHIIERLDGADSFFAALSGTMLSEKNRVEDDIIACGFASRGRRRCVYTGFSLSRAVCEICSLPESAEELALIAAKRAELKRLSKSEREHMGSEKFSALRYIIMGFLFGIIFSCLFTQLMVLYTSIIDKTMFFDELKDPMWLKIFIFCFAFCGGLFALGMAIAEKIAKKR